MATTTTTTNKPLNPRAQDLSPKGYNRANIFSGKALSFDGVNDYVSAPNISVQSTNVWTYESKIYFDAIGGYWFDGRTSDVGYGVYFDPSSKKLNLFTIISGANAFNYTFDVGRWYSIALTSNGTTAALYVEGKAVASLAYTDAPSSAGPLILGARFSLDSSWVNARLAGLRIFNTALTPAQVSDLYLNPEKIVPDGVASSALKLWLPMMEGAGASAYDGSGNGNDGTINGATWTAGIGAPVAQTALVSWDKGTNLATHSEDFANGAWTKISTSVASNTATAPNGTMTADSLNSTSSTEAIFQIAQANTIDFSVYAKAGTTTSLQLASSVSFNGRAADFNLSTGTAGAVYQLGTGDPSISGGTSSIESVGNGWYKCSINSLVLSAARAVTISNNNGNLSYIWGASLRPVTAGDAYIKTNATAQTSAVLVPEGLTAGASIFGTDIITPRNAFALNLDGASWAQVGDNASLDFGSGEFSLEAWGFRTLDNTWQSVMQKGPAGAGSTRGISLFYSNATNGFRVIITANSEITIIGAALAASTWNHVVVTRDASLVKMYVNGTFYAQISAPAGSVDESGVSYNLSVGTDTSNQRLNGQLANPRIYNRALTAAEVLRNYNADKAKFGL